ncbi:hypothetical protein BDR26DRAFT_854964 [Obelidium mucronatum]|nr:hypothetical protein BDR26DRAFT_854964 [Obelidium mucronatum]
MILIQYLLLAIQFTTTLVMAYDVGHAVGHDKMCLRGGETMWHGAELFNPLRRDKLSMQSDGNLVLYRSVKFCEYKYNDGKLEYDCSGRTWQAMWATNLLTNVMNGMVLENSMNGNLVLWSHDWEWSWNSNTIYNAPKHLCLQNDGNLVLYNQDSYGEGDAVWSTNTWRTWWDVGGKGQT